ncbi:hypothetical protein VCHC50A1_3440 [Vibrio cholerae HC-50A1]|nr:hypothetical protein VCHC50A1_3440 [Vibrio cholerae HC-50A1]
MVDVTDDKSLTQGTMFNCAYSELYKKSEILGLIITARCDIANDDKVKFYNFIPVVPFDVWREVELVSILKKRLLKSLNFEIENLIIKAGFSIGNLNTYGYEEVYKNIIKNNKLKPKELSRLDNANMKHDCLNNVNSSYSSLIHFFKNDIEKSVIDIIENKNADYFFIDDVSGYGSVIARLREIHVLDINTANKIPSGIELDRSDYACLNSSLENKFCSIVGQLRSPYLELLIQRFTNNFVRVGVDNHDTQIVSNIMEVKI